MNFNSLIQSSNFYLPIEPPSTSTMRSIESSSSSLSASKTCSKLGNSSEEEEEFSFNLKSLSNSLDYHPTFKPEKIKPYHAQIELQGRSLNYDDGIGIGMVRELSTVQRRRRKKELPLIPPTPSLVRTNTVGDKYWDLYSREAGGGGGELLKKSEGRKGDYFNSKTSETQVPSLVDLSSSYSEAGQTNLLLTSQVSSTSNSTTQSFSNLPRSPLPRSTPLTTPNENSILFATQEEEEEEETVPDYLTSIQLVDRPRLEVEVVENLPLSLSSSSSGRNDLPDLRGINPVKLRIDHSSEIRRNEFSSSQVPPLRANRNSNGSFKNSKIFTEKYPPLQFNHLEHNQGSYNFTLVEDIKGKGVIKNEILNLNFDESKVIEKNRIQLGMGSQDHPAHNFYSSNLASSMNSSSSRNPIDKLSLTTLNQPFDPGSNIMKNSEIPFSTTRLSSPLKFQYRVPQSTLLSLESNSNHFSTDASIPQPSIISTKSFPESTTNLPYPSYQPQTSIDTSCSHSSEQLGLWLSRGRGNEREESKEKLKSSFLKRNFFRSSK